MKFGIATILKNEHDYINEFIGYHINIGFTHFYILVDNICYEQTSYADYIHPEYIKYVQFFYVNNLFDPIYCKKIIDDNKNTHMYWVNFFNEKVLPTIKKEVEWIAILGCDSFLKLDKKYIVDFIDGVGDVTQIAFPWMCVFNFDNIHCDMLTHNLNKFYSLNYCDHSYTMGNTSKINHLMGHSHCFSSHDESQYIHICNNKSSEVCKFPSIPSPSEIFKLSIFTGNTKNYAIHIMLRCHDEMLIKDYFAWKNVKISDANLRDNIINCDAVGFSKKTHSGRINFIKMYRPLVTQIKLNITENILHHDNNTNHYKMLIKKLLDANELSNEQYVKFIQCVVNK
jgi:hypothetical protein